MQVYAIFCDKSHNVLIVKKKVKNSWWSGGLCAPARVNQAGQWALPGGNLNQDEKPDIGAMREFSEETGIDLKNFPGGTSGAVIKRTDQYILVCFQLSTAHLNDLCSGINHNVSPKQNNLSTPTGHVVDWELAEARVLRAAEVTQYLGVRQNISPHLDASTPRAKKPDSQKIDWYAEMAEIIKQL